MSEQTGRLYLHAGAWWFKSFPGTKHSKPVLTTLPTDDEPRIVQTPGILGGKPHIVGHRISVQNIVVWHEQMGMSIDAIATKYDLDPRDIRAALKYYADNRGEIEESLRSAEVFAAEMRQRHPSKLKARRDG